MVLQRSLLVEASGLGCFPNVSKIPETTTWPTYNPVDIYRLYITEILEPITGASAKIILPALQWTQSLEHGDLLLAVPALRLKGKKPDDVAKDIGEKVGYTANILCMTR